MKITITQANGWTKSIEPIKAATLVGSAEFTDIQLPSPSISPIQVQVLSDRQFPTGFRVIGIDGQTKVNTIQGSFLLEPFAIYDIAEDEELAIGEYLLKFQLTQQFANANSTGNIKAQLKFPDTVLQPNLTLTGFLVISNAGEKDACQFDVSLDGIPQDCYQLDPVPMLHPGGQEEVGVRLFHRKTSPAAGNLDLIFTITAPNSYPGEADKVAQRIYVSPDFSQSIEIVDDLTAGAEPVQKDNKPKPVNTSSINNVPVSTVQPLISNLPAVDSLPSAANTIRSASINKPIEIKSEMSGNRSTFKAQEIADHSTSTAVDDQSAVTTTVSKPAVESVASPEQVTPQKPQNLDLKKVKIVQNKSEDFWDES